MKLSELIKDCPGMLSVSSLTDPALNADILDITSDSRQVQKGSLFIAVKGLQADGHDYIDQSFQKGAAAVIAQHHPNQTLSQPHGPVILVENSRPCMGFLAAKFYGHPSASMTMIGITGTNGKTTITWLLENILKCAGFNPGVIGTINIRYNDQNVPNTMTTPDAIQLQQTLSQMKKAGVTHVIMEVSSHGLDLNRVDGCRFDVGVFTNLTQDHLDYHADMDEYFRCKQQLFTRFLSPDSSDLHRPEHGVAVLNIDDPKGLALFNSISYTRLSVSTRQPCDIHATQITDTINGLSATLNLKNRAIDFCSPLTGTFNLENILCAAGAAVAIDIDAHAIKTGIETCKIVPGRLEKVDHSINRYIFVDYAHTPDALESILTTLKLRTPRRLITVFGCGGDRDRSKRPLMGSIAAKYSDVAIVTSDNPRTENPQTIIEDILTGMTGHTALTDHDLETDPFKKGFLIEADRKKALEKAISLSKPKDTIVAAGKGHETYQITNTGTIHFDDVEELKKAAQSFHDRFLPMDWTIQDLSKALNTEPKINALDPAYRFSGISTDSRTIRKDQLFLAIKGENFDGHHFVQALIEQGIKGFIVERGFSRGLEKGFVEHAAQNALLIFEAADPLIALGQLARYQRLRSKVKLVAVTGSSGKTTTRRLIKEIFSTRFHTHATKGNLNNEIGVPLTLLNLSANHEWAIIEMGMNHAGEISRLSRMAMPDIALITNTAGVHLEGLKSVENVAKAKAEIFDGMQPGSTAILFAQDGQRQILEPVVQSNQQIGKILFFGSGPDADFQSTDITHENNTITFTACFDVQQCPVNIQTPARFMVDNALAAIAVAHTAGIDLLSIQNGIQAFRPSAGRMNIYPLSDTIQLIDDAYNANPSSVSQALNTLASVSQGQTSIAILGDMLELGDQSDSLHFQIGQQVANLGIDHLFLFGTQVKHLKSGAIKNGFSEKNICCATKEEIITTVSGLLTPHTWILIKGSRGMAMETVIKGLKTCIKQTVMEG